MITETDEQPCGGLGDAPPLAEPGGVELRLAGPGDGSMLHGIIQAAFGSRPPLDPPADALSDTPESVEAHLAGAPGVLASIDGEPVGCLLLSLDDDAVGLHRVSVLPSHRHAGVAAVMVRAAAQWAADYGVRILWLLARREFAQVVGWWQRYGFRVVGQQGPSLRLERPAPVRVEAPTADAMRGLGRRLARLLRPGDVIVANGDLGAGKTTLTQGLGEGLDVEGPVISPTFVLSRIHRSRGAGPGLVHVDAYRLADADELADLDLDATLADSVTLIEWGTGLAEGLAPTRLEVDIQRGSDPGDQTRIVYLAGVGSRWDDADLAGLANGEAGAAIDDAVRPVGGSTSGGRASSESEGTW